MKTNIFSMTLAGVLGIAVATSALAQDTSYDRSAEAIQKAVSNGDATNPHECYMGSDSTTTAIDQNLNN